MKRWRALWIGQTGFSLVESSVAIVLVATVTLVAVGALAVATKAAAQARTDVTAGVIARSEMEYVRSQSVASTYQIDPTLSVPSGYAVTITTSNTANTCLQQITVTVTRPGHPAITLEDYKPELEHKSC